MGTCIWSPQAELDLEEIVFHIGVGDGRPLVAEKIAAGCRDLCDLMANYPNMGEEMPSLGPELRGMSYRKRWLIVFRPSNDGIEVVRLVDGWHEYENFF